MTRIMGSRAGWVMTVAAPMILAASLAAQPAPATIHGKVTNTAGAAMNHGDVKLTTDKSGDSRDRKFPYSFPVDASGTYKGTGIAPADYLIVYFADGKSVDFQNVTIKAGDDRTVDFDMTRAEYLKGMSAEDKAALEEYKKKNAAVSAENAKIGNINATLKQARDDEHNGKPDVAVTSLQALTQQKADEPVIWASLGEAQLAVADAAFKAAQTAKTSTADPAIQAKYSDAAASYQKAMELNAVSKKPSSELMYASYLNLGAALAKSGKLPESSAAYENAAKAIPANAGTAYFNEAAIFFNAGKLDEAAAAADKSIAADPKRAGAYYIKGQALIPKATSDPKTGKFILPPGCLEAYQEYLALEPNGAHSKDVTELLAGLGQPVKNTFKAGKK